MKPGKTLKRRRGLLPEVLVADVASLGTDQKTVLDQWYVEDAKRRVMYREFVMRCCHGNA